MAICAWCDVDTTTASSCAVKAFHRSGVACPLPPRGFEGPLVTFGPDDDEDGRDAEADG